MPEEIKKSLMPKTGIGQGAFWTAVAALVLLGLGILDSAIEPLRLPPGAIAVIAGILAFILSLVALTKKKERNALIYFALVVGIFSIILLIAEVFFLE